jgi:hypothetical protein
MIQPFSITGLHDTSWETTHIRIQSLLAGRESVAAHTARNLVVQMSVVISSARFPLAHAATTAAITPIGSMYETSRRTIDRFLTSE